MSIFCCVRRCLDGLSLAPDVPHVQRQNLVHLDTSYMGYEVVVVKGGLRVCGSGGVLGNAPIVQSKAYFEVNVQQSGTWAVGLATRQTDLSLTQGGMDKFSWTLGSNHIIRHDKQELHKIDISSLPEDVTSIQEGVTIGVAFDHIQLKFFINGSEVEYPVTCVKGKVYPVLYDTVATTLVEECADALESPGDGKRVTLMWVPGHMGVPGNEKADELARTGASTQYVGPEPLLGTTRSHMQSRLNKWANDAMTTTSV